MIEHEALDVLRQNEHQRREELRTLQDLLNRSLSLLRHLKEDNLRLRIKLRDLQQVREQNAQLKLQLQLVTDMMAELREKHEPRSGPGPRTEHLANQLTDVEHGRAGLIMDQLNKELHKETALS